MFFSWVVRNEIKFAAYLKKQKQTKNKNKKQQHNYVHNNSAMLAHTY